ncbi:MAG: hypothetical protein KKB77_06045 [Bacteroidetes bacterium]|nr:hypothetical protein [Bacteroidota bacterium]
MEKSLTLRPSADGQAGRPKGFGGSQPKADPPMVESPSLSAIMRRAGKTAQRVELSTVLRDVGVLPKGFLWKSPSPSVRQLTDKRDVRKDLGVRVPRSPSVS